MTGLIITSIIAAILAIAFMVIRVTMKPVYGMLSKAVASVGFITVGVTAFVTASVPIPFGAPLIILGLVLGLIGDIVLDEKRIHSETDLEGTYLTSGMLSFISGHIVYLVAICLVAVYTFGLNLLLPLLVSGGIGVIAGPLVILLSTKVMKQNFGKHKIIAGFYGGFLMAFTVLALWLTILNSVFLIFFLGMLFFLISDLVLSKMYFEPGQKENKVLVVVNHSTYYAAQILIAVWLFTLLI